MQKALALRGVKTDARIFNHSSFCCIVGAIAGWLAGIVVKGYGFGLIGNIVVGVVGAFIGEWLFPQLGLSEWPGSSGSILSATLGAILLLLVIGLVRRVA